MNCVQQQSRQQQAVSHPQNHLTVGDSRQHIRHVRGETPPFPPLHPPYLCACPAACMTLFPLLLTPLPSHPFTHLSLLGVPVLLRVVHALGDSSVRRPRLTRHKAAQPLVTKEGHQAGNVGWGANAACGGGERCGLTH